MFIKLCTSGLASHGAYLRNTEYDLLSLTPHLIATVERYARQCADVDCKRPFVKWGEETSAKREEHPYRHDKKQSRAAYPYPGLAQRMA